jgi:plastocyanin
VLTFLFRAIASTVLILLLSLSACRSNQTAVNQQPTNMNGQSQTSPQPRSQTSAQTADATVKIRNFKFEPETVAIAVGQTIQFINIDEEPHTATSTDGTFDSKALDTDQTWNYTVNKVGTYPYLCSIHPFMKGTLTVTP